MRYDPDQKQRTRERIVREAAAAIRRHGPDKVGVATLMARAGLTHGGFYAHFKSKDALVQAALASMFDEQFTRFRSWVDGLPPAQALDGYVDRYLSLLHRDHPEQGCPVAALSSEVGRMSPKTRKGFEAGVNRMTDGIAELVRALPRSEPERLASSMVAEMVGALAMARAVADPARSRSILEAAKQSIRERIGLREFLPLQ